MSERIQPPAPGIYFDVPMATYLSWQAWSASALKLGYLHDGGFSLAHIRHALDHPEPATDYQKLGSLLHSLVLEPELLLDGFVAMPDFAAQVRTKDGKVPASPRATAEYKKLVLDFAAANAGKVLVDPDEMERMRGMAAAVRGHKLATSILRSSGQSEVSLVWVDQETGLTCKRRSDKAWLELKTTADIGRFRGDIVRFGYDIQLAMETDGRAALGERVKECGIIAVQSVEPYVVQCAPVSAATIHYGRERYRRALRAVKTASESSEWPGPADPDSWDLPAWLLSEVQAPTFGGKGGMEWD